MNNGDLLLVGVIVVAFIAGYAVVSFVANKLKPKNPAPDSRGRQPGGEGPDSR
ncbi:MAG: hypothetical protein WCL44_00565 [bacterium]